MVFLKHYRLYQATRNAGVAIFEWDLARGTATYSEPFWTMLGWRKDHFPETIQSFKDQLHPDDQAHVLAHIDECRSGTIPEYLSIFRLKHKNGHWVWINACGKTSGSRLAGMHADISHIQKHLSHLSHEIRTPLSVISGVSEIFDAMQTGFDEKQKQLIKALNSSTAVLKGIVNTLSDLSKK